MALDYWKLGGKPSGYNPLPTGWVAILSLPTNSYVLTFRAKSQSGAQLRITDLGASDYDQSYALTNDWKTYSLSFNVKSVKSYNVGFNDYSSKGDIIIDSIQLVRKPLPKLTINGIDGFLSGKWVFANGVTVIDDQNIVLNTSSIGQGSYISVNVTPNTDYVVQCTSNAEFAIYDNVPSAILLSYYNSSPRTFNSGNNSVIRLYLKNANVASGTFTFSKPMLNLGTTKAPYEPKRGDKMIMPVAKQNLLTVSNYSYNGVANSGFLEDVTTNLVQGGTYTASGLYSIFPDDDSVNDRVSLTFYYTDGTSTTVNNGMNTQIRDGVERFISISATANIAKTLNKIRVWHFDYSTVTSKMHRTARQVQLEQGTTATPYTPYAVQVNRKPKLSKGWEYAKLDGSLAYNTYSSANSGTHSVYIQNFFSSNKSSLVFDIRNNNGNVIPGVDVPGLNNTYLYVKNIPDSITRFAAGSTPTPAQWQSFFSANPFHLAYKLDSTVRTTSVSTFPTFFSQYQTSLLKVDKGISMSNPVGINTGGNYLTFPYTYGDSGAIECVFTPLRVDYNYNTILDCKSDSNNWEAWVYTGGVLGVRSNSLNTFTSGPTVLFAGQRYKFRYEWTRDGLCSLYLNDVLMTSAVVPFPSTNSGGAISLNGMNIGNSKGNNIFYSLKVWNNGVLELNCDFENQRNIIGTQVLTNAQNLIPSFEDSRWSIHPNAKVLGKDVLHLDATSSFQTSTITVPTLPNKQYFIPSYSTSVNKYTAIRFYTSNMTMINEVAVGNVTTPSNCAFIMLLCSNTTTGSFDFIRPQLYQLSGQEGTINGAPKVLLKPAKRQLYSKR